MIKDSNPCMDCQERHQACHDKCKERAAWLLQYNQEKERISRSKKINYYFKHAISESIRIGKHGS